MSPDAAHGTVANVSSGGGESRGAEKSQEQRNETTITMTEHELAESEYQTVAREEEITELPQGQQGRTDPNDLRPAHKEVEERVAPTIQGDVFLEGTLLTEQEGIHDEFQTANNGASNHEYENKVDQQPSASLRKRQASQQLAGEIEKKSRTDDSTNTSKDPSHHSEQPDTREIPQDARDQVHDSTQEEHSNADVSDQNEINTSQQEQGFLRRSARLKGQGAPNSGLFIQKLHSNDADVPNTYSQACTGPFASYWKEAMNDEINNFE